MQSDYLSAEDSNPWRGYKQCLEAPFDGTHVAILQDDVIPCRNFVPALDLIAEANPDNPVCLFTPGLPLRSTPALSKARGKRQSYCDLHTHDLLPVVAVLWPREKTHEVLTWAAEHPLRLPGGPEARSDDACCGRWMRYTRQRVRATIPSLVQHPDDVPSTVPRRETRMQKRVSNGKDRGRVAWYWIGNADPLAIDWS